MPVKLQFGTRKSETTGNFCAGRDPPVFWRHTHTKHTQPPVRVQLRTYYYYCYYYNRPIVRPDGHKSVGIIYEKQNSARQPEKKYISSSSAFACLRVNTKRSELRVPSGSETATVRSRTRNGLQSIAIIIRHNASSSSSSSCLGGGRNALTLATRTSRVGWTGWATTITPSSVT